MDSGIWLREQVGRLRAKIHASRDTDLLPRRVGPLLLLVGVCCLLAVAGCGLLVSPAGGPAEAGPNGLASGVPSGGASSSPAVTPIAPPLLHVPNATDLEQETASGQPLTIGGWSANAVVLSFRGRASSGEMLVPEVELAKANQAFSGTPTARGAPIEATDGRIQAKITVSGLAPGQYRWQARFSGTESGQGGKWTVFTTEDVAFGIVTGVPAIEHLDLSGATRSPDGVLVVNQRARPQLEWTAAAEPPSALDHLVYIADHQEQAVPASSTGGQVLPPNAHSLDISSLADGQWYLHLWAVDKAGQAGKPATLAVTIARTPPTISDVVFRSWATNPLYQTVPIRFTISRSASVHLTVLEQATSAQVRAYDLGHRPANKEIDASWDGKDEQNQVVATGEYAFLIDVVDDAGNHVQARYNGLNITDKVIRVSLAKQSLTAYAGSQPFLTTLVTTGGRALPTPTGTFEILSKQSPFVFHSPYPKGSPYWYADVTTHQAMLFYQAGADFIHDAPWRTVFGPGSDGPGIPGATFTGSHGCVELPANAMPKLYDWTPLGTPVIVTP